MYIKDYKYRGAKMNKSWRISRTLKPNFHKHDVTLCPATKFFDQISFIGDEVVGCFVIETQKGIILLDCMHPEQRCIDLIEKGFEDLQLNIHDLYAIVISHGHGDHFGRADYFKEKYGALIYMSKTDYELAHNMPEHFPWKSVTFSVDHYLQDQEVLDFGDVKIKAVHTPGHTQGCFSFIIPVTDEGRQHHVALWGGAGILPDSNKEDYYQSLVKFTSLCCEAHVDGEIATHPCLDMGLHRYEMVRTITDGMPNPFVLGEEGYQYYERQFYNYVKEYWESK